MKNLIIFFGLDEPTSFCILLIIIAIAWAAFYYTIKAAVKNGMLDATISKDPLEAKKQALTDRYNSGELKMDEYKKQFDELK